MVSAPLQVYAWNQGEKNMNNGTEGKTPTQNAEAELKTIHTQVLKLAKGRPYDLHITGGFNADEEWILPHRYCIEINKSKFEIDTAGKAPDTQNELKALLMPPSGDCPLCPVINS